MNKNTILAIVVGAILILVVGAYFLNQNKIGDRDMMMHRDDDMRMQNDMMMEKRRKADMMNAELDATLNSMSTSTLNADLEVDLRAIDKAI